MLALSLHRTQKINLNFCCCLPAVSPLRRQLREYRPTRTVVVVSNEGFRACAKPGVTSPAQDLWHANQFVATHADAANLEAVLILEDDVRFLPALRTTAPLIEALLVRNAERAVGYTLGTCPLASVPAGEHHLRVLLNRLLHARGGCSDGFKKGEGVTVLKKEARATDFKTSAQQTSAQQWHRH